MENITWTDISLYLSINVSVFSILSIFICNCTIPREEHLFVLFLWKCSYSNTSPSLNSHTERHSPTPPAVSSSAKVSLSLLEVNLWCLHRFVCTSAWCGRTTPSPLKCQDTRVSEHLYLYKNCNKSLQLHRSSGFHCYTSFFRTSHLFQNILNNFKSPRLHANQ